MSDEVNPKGQSPSLYKAYLIRLWCEESVAVWRASAQFVDGGEVVRFASLEALFAFLQAQTSPTPQSNQDNRENR